MSDLGTSRGKNAPPRFSAVFDRLREKRTAVAPGIRRRSLDQGAIPLSFAQQRLWFMEQLEPGTPIYNIPVAMTFTGLLDVAALALSLGESVRRHEALRTTFRAAEGQALQVIGPPGSLELPVVDLGDLGGLGDDRELPRLMLADARRTFDLENGPLLRAMLVRLGPERHVLLVSLHHLVGDAWSVAVLLQELIAVYTASVQGRTALLPELALQYPDFALWQRDWLQGEVLERYLSVWRGRLAGSPAVLNLPTDRPRPARRSDEGRRLPLQLPAALVRRLEAVARGAETTLFTLVLAALQVALHRWSGEDDLVVGTPVANRRRTELQGLVGLFVNMLAMRADLGGRPTLRAFLKRTHERVLEAQDHQELPFERVVEELQPERTASHAPLFQVILAFQNVPMPRIALPGCEIETQSVDPGTSMFDLSLNLEDRGDGLAGWWEYSTALFDDTTLRRLDTRFHLLMEGMEEGLDRPLEELPFLTGPERHQAEREWNDTAVLRPPDLLHRLVADQAERTPEAEAVVSETERVPYRELARRSGLLARRLSALGVGPDVPVGVFAERSVELVVALLGILEAGGAYVPLDPDYPAERLAFMARDARMPVILTHSHLSGSVPDAGAAVVLVDAELEEVGSIGDMPRRELSSENLTYVIFTSGSTGRPKGAMLPHAGICNRLLWMQEAYGLGPGDRVLQKTPFSFDVSVWEFFWPLMTGATLVMARPGGHQDPAYLSEILEAEAITTLHFVPSMLQVFLAQEDIGPCSSLRRVMLSGEALPEDLRRRFHERLPGVAMHNLYGPTEASVDVTFWACPRENALGLVPIGRPVANTRIHLVDPAFHPVPPGAPGELVIAGVSLARGYLGRPDLTGERFVPDPFSTRPGERLYRTGDLARYLPDGSVDYLGRIDNQVKLRGFRIELGEIEARLLEHPGVAEAAVVIQGSGPEDQRLVAFLVPLEETLPPVSDLRAFLADRLPDFMTPAVFLKLARMPLTPSGKVDRRALPQAGTGEATGETAAAAPPRTPAEEVLCEIWADVLGVRPGIHDNFFALGGHSLLAPRIAAKVRQALGVDAPLRVLFDHPTVARLAAALQEKRWPRQGAEPPLVPARREGPLPLSFPQLRFWVRRAGSGISNIPLGISLTGVLDVPALHASLQEIVRRHDSLRAGFTESAEGPIQLIRPEARLELPTADLSALPEEIRKAEALRLTAAEGRHRFDFGRDLLLRALLLHLGDLEHALFLVKCHLVTDGWSETVLIDELGALYEAFARRAPSPLPELPVQYGDFAVWQRAALQGPAFDELLGYWIRRLDGGRLPVLPLPLDFPRPAVVDARAGRSRRTLPAELSEGLRQLGRREGASLFMTLLTAFDAFLARWTGHTDIALTTNTANRGRAEIERLIGLFTNVLALRADLSGDPTFREALARVRASTLEAYAHQELPFVELLERFHLSGPEAYNELFPAGFVLQGFRSSLPAFPGLEARPISLASGLAPRDLILVVIDRDTEMEALLLYRANLFRPATVDGLMAAFEAILAAVVENPELRVSALPWPMQT